MKKYTSILLALVFALSLFSFNVNSISAYDSGCISGRPYSSTTGALCGTSPAVECPAGSLFNSLTGERCTVWVDGSDGSAVSQNYFALNDFFRRELSVGSKGNDVKVLQQVLQKDGYLAGNADGSFGILTKNALTRYQTANGVSATGRADEATLQLIKARSWYTMCPLINLFGLYTCPTKNLEPVITTPVDAQSPVITGVSGPQTLKINEQGTWTVTAYDQNKGIGNLSYYISWGDENKGTNSAQQSKVRTTADQNVTFSHIYKKAGTYTPTFKVTNFDGKSAQKILSVKVGNVSNTSVSGDVKITTDSLPAATTGSTYYSYVSGSGGSDSYYWNVTSGSLPQGLSITSAQCSAYPCKASAVISGTPTTAGSSTFTIKLTSGNSSVSRTFTINVSNVTTNPSQAPTISSLYPSSGPAGAKVIIYGTGFATGPQATTNRNTKTPTNSGENFVSFGSTQIPGSIMSIDGRSLTFIVPTEINGSNCSADACTNGSSVVKVRPGTYPITVSNSNGTSNQASFTVTSEAINPLPTHTGGCSTTKSGGYSPTTGEPC